MNQVLIIIPILLSVGMRASASGDKYEQACPAGSKCYGARGNYSAIGYRGCIRTFDCNVQINMVLQKNKYYGGFDYFYFVCMRVPNSTLTMYFTPDVNNTDGRGMIQARVKVTNSGNQFRSFILKGSDEVRLDPTPDTASMISGFHLSNKHLVKVKDSKADGTRGLGDEEDVHHDAGHAGDGLPILHCLHDQIVMFFSQADLFYNSSNATGIQPLNLKHSKNLYLKIRLTDKDGAEIENVSITLLEPGSGRTGVIFIVVIAAFVILTCTKCCNYCVCCRCCCPNKEPTDVEAQAETAIEV